MKFIPFKNKKVMRKTIVLFVLAFASAALLNSCAKEQNDNPLLASLVTSEDALTMQDLMEDNDAEMEDRIEFRSGPDGCPTVTVTPEGNVFPKTIVIDYGDAGCTGPRGRLRQGRILINQTAPMRNAGAVRTVEFDNYRVDGVLVEADVTLTNTGVDALGNVSFSRSVQNGSLTYPNGQIATWNSAHTMVQTAGGNTILRIDDAFEINGSINGVNRRGDTFSMTITEPLVKTANCPWIVSGVKTFVVNDLTRTLDYGDGACDNEATLTLADGTTRTVRVRGWWR